MDNLNIKETIYEVICKIRTSRNRPHAENSSKSVAKNLGLDKEQVKKHLESLVETGAVYITLMPKGEDSYFIFDFDKLGVSDSKESVEDCIEPDSDKMEPEESRFGMDNVLEGINETSLPNNSASGSNRSDFFVLLDLISSLSNDVWDLNAKLEGMPKRTKNCWKIIISSNLKNLSWENKEMRKTIQRNAKRPWEKSHVCPDSSVPSIGCPTVQRIMQLQKHNMDPNNVYVHTESSNDKAVEMI